MPVFRSFLSVLALLSCAPTWSHEFWLQSTSYSPRLQAQVDLSAHVGEYYVGELVGVTATHAASVRVLSSTGTQDLASRIPTGSMLPSLRLSFATPGTHMVTYDSHPSQVVLSADKFHAYLHDEGLDAVIRQREAAGTAASAGRERFRRNAKILLRAGDRSDSVSLAAAGQRLEILPLADPLIAFAGDRFRFQLRFEGKALAGALVKAWHKKDGQTTAIRSTSDAQGHVTFDLPFAGPWLLNTVHMLKTTDAPDVDWDSFWSSLTFEVKARVTTR